MNWTSSRAIVASALIPFCGSVPAIAGIERVNRLSDYAIAFSDPAFSDAVFHGRIILDWEADVVGDPGLDCGGTIWRLPPDSFALGVTPLTNCFVDFLDFDYQEQWVDILVLLCVEADGLARHEVAWKLEPDGEVLVVEEDGLGNPVLRYLASSGGGTDDGRPHQWQVSLTGDWSDLGTGAGQAELVSINPLWTITKNFEFDGAVTVFRAEIDAWLGDGAHNVDVEIVLHGGTDEHCAPDLDGSGTLDLFDFLAFVSLFNAGDPAADCDGSGTLTLFDFLCFTNAFSAGC